MLTLLEKAGRTVRLLQACKSSVDPLRGLSNKISRANCVLWNTARMPLDQANSAEFPATIQAEAWTNRAPPFQKICF